MPRIVTTRRALLLGALTLATADLPTPGIAGGKYANPQLLVETDELARMVGAPGVRIVDVRSGMRGSVSYRVGHVPGAVLLDASELDDPAATSRVCRFDPRRRKPCSDGSASTTT